jgi:hypothetical protein
MSHSSCAAKQRFANLVDQLINLSSAVEDGNGSLVATLGEVGFGGEGLEACMEQL